MRLRHYILQIDVLFIAVWNTIYCSLCTDQLRTWHSGQRARPHNSDTYTNMRSSRALEVLGCHRISHSQPVFQTLWPFQPLIPSDPDQKYLKGFSQ